MHAPSSHDRPAALPGRRAPDARHLPAHALISAWAICAVLTAEPPSDVKLNANAEFVGLSEILPGLGWNALRSFQATRLLSESNRESVE